MRLLEPRWLGVGRVTVKLRPGTISAPIKILHLSDLHASPVVSLKFIERAIAKGLELKPDLIFLTGDFISGKFSEFDAYAEVLSPLAKAAPCLAILGNHDGGSWARARGGYVNTQNVRDLLTRSGARLLYNESTVTQVAGTSLRIVGLGDWWADECDPKAGFAADSPGQQTPTVLLTHNPDTKELVRPYSWDVAFCGHTHGGQLQIPLFGAPFAPVRDKRIVKGLHEWEGRWIYVTKGVGNLLGMRLNCRPEISLVTLT
jgi:predicted MPP superfamily phosphohydrolase